MQTRVPKQAEADRRGMSALSGQLSGRVPDVESVEQEEVVKGPRDAAGPVRSTRRVAPARRADPGAAVLRLSTRATTSAQAVPRDPDSFRDKDDSLSTTVATSWSNPGGKRTSAFGSESFKPSFKNIKWTADKGVVDLGLKLDVKCPWGVKSSNVNIASGASSKITLKNYQAIVDDLTPELEGGSWRAPRGKYWSKPLCERHEKYHSTDDERWVKGPGEQLVRDYLNGVTITVPDKDRDNEGRTKKSIDKQVRAAVKRAKDELTSANFAFYTGGAAQYVDYAGEVRANSDGKPHYEALAADVQKRGEALEAAQAKKQADKEEKKRIAAEAKKERADGKAAARSQWAQEQAAAPSTAPSTTG